MKSNYKNIEKKNINKVFEINYVKKYMFFNGERAKVRNDEVLAMKDYIKNKNKIKYFLLVIVPPFIKG